MRKMAKLLTFEGKQNRLRTLIGERDYLSKRLQSKNKEIELFKMLNDITDESFYLNKEQ